MIDGDTIEDPAYEYLRGYALELFADAETAFWVTVDANCAEDFLEGVDRGRHAKDHIETGGRRVRPYYYHHNEAMYEWFRYWLLTYYYGVPSSFQTPPMCRGCLQGANLGYHEGGQLLKNEFLAQGGHVH